MDEKKPQYLDILQILRGLAALMVVIHHSAGSLRFYHKIDNPFLDFIGGLGKFGVDFFFVLSGFIISYSAHFKFRQPRVFSNYIKSRLIRIYVPYLPIGIFMLALYSFFPGFSNGSRQISALTSITLLPDGNPALSVAWTLTFELCFYFLFCFYFVSKKCWNYFVILWIAAILVVNYSGLISPESVKNLYLKIFLSFYNLEFILGYLLSLVIIKEVRINFKLVVASIFCLSIPLLYWKFFSVEWFAFSLNLLFSLIAFMIVYLAIVFYNFKIKNTAIFMMIGNATYSIYLIHNPLQMMLIRFLPNLDSFWGIVLALLLAIIISSFVGYLYYLVMEKKAMRFIMKKFTS